MSDIPLDLTIRRQPIAMSRQPSKRSLTLDLNAPSKKARLSAAATPLGQPGAPPILTTPDVQMLKLSSPELAKFLNSNQTLATPTPSGYLFPKTVTEEQELYAKGFEVALENMHKQTGGSGSSGRPNETAISTIEKATAAHRSNLAIAANAIAEQPPLPVDLPSYPPQIHVSRPSSGASGSIDGNSDTANNLLAVKKEEEDLDDDDQSTGDESLRDNSSSNNTMSPIDMESQERIKLERKRMRNRVAASKCRKRKLERISQLDDKVQKLKGENGELASVVKKLKEAVCNLKQEVIEHMNSGCQILLSDVSAL